MTGWLDRLPAPVRHLVFSVTAIVALALLNYASTEYTHWGLSPVAEAVIASALPLIIAAVTPWTQQYGVGSGTLPAPEVQVDAPQDQAGL